MNNVTTLSFGRYLKAVRLQKGISLEHVAESTKIGTNLLLAIEREEHQHLPVEVYVKGFIRSYAKAIGADGDLAVQNYQGSRDIYQRSAQSENDLKKSEKDFWPRLMLSLGVLVFFMVVSVSVVYVFKRESHPDAESRLQATETASKAAPAYETQQLRLPEEGQPKSGEQTIPGPSPEHRKTSPGPSPEHRKTAETRGRSEQAPMEERLFLHIKAKEETWIKIIVDNHNTKEYTLKPGDRLALEADLGYNLLIGNAGGLELALNGEPIKIPGRTGEVVTLKVP